MLAENLLKKKSRCPTKCICRKKKYSRLHRVKFKLAFLETTKPYSERVQKINPWLFA